MTIITRKIRIHINEKEKHKFSAHWKELFRIADICRKSANYVSSHMVLQDFMKDLIYLSEDAKVKIADINKDEIGILTTSSQNSTYRLLSKKFKGEIPSLTLSSINATIRKTYCTEKKEIVNGEKSLRTYRQNIPIPISSVQLKKTGRLITKEYEKDDLKKSYETIAFSFYSIPFVMSFGRDRSGNRIIVDRSVFSDDYKLCESSIQIKKNRQSNRYELYLLLCVDVPLNENKLIKDKSCIANLSPDFPIVCSINSKEFHIGSNDEYTYRRLRIQSKLRKLQSDLKFSSGGRGRKSKLVALNRYHELEKNYIETKTHQYSKELIKICVNNRCEKLILVDIQKVVDVAKKNDFLLRNWSYFGLINKIKYKAKIENIEVIIT